MPFFFPLQEKDVFSSLLEAPRELKYTAPALMNNFRSSLVLYGTEPPSTKLFRSLGGPSKRTNLESQRAVIGSGADLHIWNLKDAMKLFSNLQISKLDVTGVSGKTTRADRQGTLVLLVKGP